ncbi:type VII secretion target [Lentzea flaviverrucosa]|uniref:Excreted virulence factor EspC, type VII ESX diderm n=1 Tax=Lentzea flaviverrucosa TaxID=200379 RepID=A0A1H9RLW7_9PSEU|nr:type VII secretion target [Lentzea flaviverrucosa]RDI33065.1 excreted virulence factor EspC (type VII ESX diderm) [Lentzea flaviverrucosa]SER73760.1 Excreted virulence factor EspC, type VII ESX diderm [Lentzea flaviverrucosa]
MSEEATSWGKRGSFLPKQNVQSVLGTGVADIAAASNAVAAATGSGAFSVDPAVVDSMVKKLREMKDALAEVFDAKRELTADTKLGGGYAQQMSQLNKQFGENATQQLVDITKVIQSLIEQVEKSRASYQNVDQSQADSLKKLNGK